MYYYFYEGYLVIDFNEDQIKISREELLEFLGLEKLSEFREIEKDVGVA